MRYISRTLSLLAIAMLLIFQVASISVFAASAPVRFTIPNTTLTVKGFTSPRAFVEIYDSNNLIGTVVADVNGIFEKNFQSMTAGLHNIRISYDDANKFTADPISQTINIRPQADTAVQYFLPPTLNINPISLEEGELISFSGSTIPNAIVEIVLDGGNLILHPQSNAAGNYAISVDSTGYYFGEHNITATSGQGGLSSFSTLKQPFIIVPVGSGQGNNQTLPRTLDPPIIFAKNGKIETNQDSQLIRGSAPANTQIIILLDGEPIGSTFSNTGGSWFFNIDLSASKHQVRAIACIDNQCSDFSNLLIINHSSNFGRCSTFRSWLNDYRFWGIKHGDGINLELTGLGGTPPYEFIIDWGDSVIERFNRNTATSFKIHHIYENNGQFNGNLTISDNTSCQYSNYFSTDVISGSFDWRIMSITGGLGILIIYSLRRRYLIHVRKLILAR